MQPIGIIKYSAVCSLAMLATSCGSYHAQAGDGRDLRHDYRPYHVQYAGQPPAELPGGPGGYQAGGTGAYSYENYNYEDYAEDGYIPPPPTVEDREIEPEEFRQPLEAYGRWESAEEYGSVWIPAQVEAGWRPYTVGHWAYTDYGWTWVSYEPFGWATYHYGRWVYLPHGWAWVPGRVWGPAWVSWRYGDGYCGWAPLPPARGFAASVEIWSTPMIPHHHYSFVSASSFCRPHVHRYILGPERHLGFYHRTTSYTHITVVNHRVINRGLDVRYIERHADTRITPAPVRTVRRPDDATRFRGTGVAVFRPALQGSTIPARTVKEPRYPDGDRADSARPAVQRPSRDDPRPAQPTAPRAESSAQGQASRAGPYDYSRQTDPRVARQMPTAIRPEAIRPSRDVPAVKVDRPPDRPEVIRPSRDVGRAQARPTPAPAPRAEARPTPAPAPRVEARPTPAPRVEARPTPAPRAEARPTPAPSRDPERPAARPPERPSRDQPAPARGGSSERADPRSRAFRN
jgi:hypothetical protein